MKILNFIQIICFNKILNSKYIGGAKTFFHFQRALEDILDLYKNKNAYKSRYLSITGVLAFHYSKNPTIDLIENKDIKSIMENYKKYVRNNKKLKNLLNKEDSDYSSSNEDLLDINKDDIYNNDIIDSYYNDESKTSSMGSKDFIDNNDSSSDHSNNSEKRIKVKRDLKKQYIQKQKQMKLKIIKKRKI